ncbi:twisted gastrulation precursor [Saccoglossus kowalevskii]|uniref:Twisted gastrulation n=1 Tax=Saccoglossus kowalevskii TaxID=10224 RepID=Q0PL68_SACKO|nr:twisted gastrulation precursor [Saccoglossus kowalevskii]ABG91336.1 twisted gastrulation [Saccoglossus kowalevskii]
MEKQIIRVLLFTLSVCYAIYLVHACNEAMCASDVSKCQLMESCSCNFKNHSCSQNCSRCLGPLYTECCDCVGMCKPRNFSHKPYAAKSIVEDLREEAIPSLFDALTEDGYIDYDSQWSVVKFTHLVETLYSFKPPNKDEDKALNKTLGKECTVVYLHECISMDKCSLACQSMGASAYRWFHSKCCECIGHMCLSYGKNEPMCKAC